MVQVHVPQGVGVRVPPWAPPGFSGSAVCCGLIVISSISAHVAELVDAHGSGPCAARCGGSSPSVGTTLPDTRFSCGWSASNTGSAAHLHGCAAFFVGGHDRRTP